MSPKSKTSSAAFTLIELLVVIAIIAALAGLIVGLSAVAGRSKKISVIRAEMERLVTAIESYRTHFGHLPPDNRTNSAVPPLFYELTGTVVNNQTGEIRSLIDHGTMTSVEVMATFGVEGFVHASSDPKQLKQFLTLKAIQSAPLPRTNLKILTVPFPWPDQSNGPIPGTTINPYRYVSTNPTNNPGSFDLWAEFVDGKKVKIICNWTKEILERPL
jgi:prepilin-type N-terminal cleavage/methylation domain-containing protein